MTDRKKTVYLVDGSALFYRAYFAFIRNPLINSKGENTSATFGFVNSLLKIINEEKPDYIAIAFDTKQPTFRHEMYPEYKSTRAKMPDELVEQLPRIRQATEALNIPYYELEGYEADDIIGTMAKRAENEGLEVWCVTGDKDFFQLVSDNIKIYNPKGSSGEPDRYGPDEVKAKFGVYPDKVTDKLALMGDSSDNVPGIPGIGPKTADSLLEQFGSLDSVLENYEAVKAKGTRQKIADHSDSARISRELVIIKTDVPVEYNLEDIRKKEINYELAKDLFLQLEFNRLLKSLLPESDTADIEETAPAATAADYRRLSSVNELKDLVKRLSNVKEIAVDTETTSLDALEADLVGISLTDRARIGYYIPLGHTTDSDMNLPRDESLKLLKKLFENPRVQKFGQNIKYDFHVLRRCGIEIAPIGFDTMVASYVIDPSARDKSLNFLAMKYFDYQMQPITDLIGSGKNQKTFDTVPVDKATFYAAEDADYTFRLRGELAPLIDDHGMNNLYYNIELPLISVLADMEFEGIRIDTGFLGKLSGEMETRIDRLKKKIYSVAGTEFNINSTQQLSHILFEKLGLPTKGRTAKKTGYSTDVKVLEELAELHEFPKLVLDYRQLTKLQSTYIDAIPRLVRKDSGRVHTSFNQTIATTGRLSSTDPNLQNIPVRTEEGREIRKAFIPRDTSHVLLVADYSQIELRILAHYSEDKGLIKAFRNREDIHARTAAEVYGVDIGKVTPEMRRAAKTANFAVIYGVTAYGLSQQSELNLEESREFIDTYFERYPGIRDYMEKMKKTARDIGYVTTLFNRRRYLPEIHSKNFNVRQFAERIAINTPIQGTAADMIKVAMIKIHRKMAGMRSKMVLQVHDELVFDTHKDELSTVREIVAEGMEKAMKIKVPIVVDLGVGDNWLDAK